MSKGVEQAPSKMLALPGDMIASPLRGSTHRTTSMITLLICFRSPICNDRETPSAAWNANPDGSSGTSYIFTNFLATSTKSTVGKGPWPYAPTKSEISTYASTPSYAVAAAHNGGVAAAVASTKDSIGYIEYSYILLNKKLAGSVADILNGDGKYLAPSVKGIQADAALFPHVSATNFAIVFGKSATAYPIAGYTWAVVWKQQNATDTDTSSNSVAATTGTLLVKYLDWLSHTGTKSTGIAGQDIAAEDGYVALPTNVQSLATSTLLLVTSSTNKKLL